MKNIVLTILALVILSSITYPQKMRDRMKQNRGKLEQLEKIKLIEALDLNEDTAIRFFARRNDFKNEINILEDNSDEILVELEKTFKSTDKNQEQKQKQLITKFLNIRESIELNRKKFFESLSDILSMDKIARLMVFEKKFRDEIRNVLLDKKRP
jgi:hypothetical protein